MVRNNETHLFKPAQRYLTVFIMTAVMLLGSGSLATATARDSLDVLGEEPTAVAKTTPQRAPADVRTSVSTASVSTAPSPTTTGVPQTVASTTASTATTTHSTSTIAGAQTTPTSASAQRTTTTVPPRQEQQRSQAQPGRAPTRQQNRGNRRHGVRRFNVVMNLVKRLLNNRELHSTGGNRRARKNRHRFAAVLAAVETFDRLGREERQRQGRQSPRSDRMQSRACGAVKRAGLAKHESFLREANANLQRAQKALEKKALCEKKKEAAKKIKLIRSTLDSCKSKLRRLRRAQGAQCVGDLGSARQYKQIDLYQTEILIAFRDLKKIFESLNNHAQPA